MNDLVMVVHPDKTYNLISLKQRICLLLVVKPALITFAESIPEFHIGALAGRTIQEICDYLEANPGELETV